MTTELVNQIARQAMETTLLVSSPILLVSLGIGLIIALFQAITSIQEMTLTFVPKIIAVFLSILLLLPWMIRVLVEFTLGIFSHIASVGGH